MHGNVLLTFILGAQFLFQPITTHKRWVTHSSVSVMGMDAFDLAMGQQLQYNDNNNAKV